VRRLLLRFQRRYATVARKHGQIRDTDSRAAILEAIEAGYLRAEPRYKIPQHYRMLSWRADRDVTYLMEWFIPAARAAAKAAGLDTFHKRLAAIQDLGDDLAELEDELLGCFDPDDYTPGGRLKGSR
jgi:hypothetical protein